MWSTLAGGHLMKVVNLTGFTVLETEMHYTIVDNKVTGTENSQTYCCLHPQMNTGHNIKHLFA
jgi:hypothetical protein